MHNFMKQLKNVVDSYFSGRLDKEIAYKKLLDLYFESICNCMNFGEYHNM